MYHAFPHHNLFSGLSKYNKTTKTNYFHPLSICAWSNAVLTAFPTSRLGGPTCCGCAWLFKKNVFRRAELSWKTQPVRLQAAESRTPSVQLRFREIRARQFPEMVAKRIRSEYMKKFKDPKWETYTKCYEEMLRYRLTRRLLEHTHNPWFWSGSDSDSDSGGGRSPPPPTKNQNQNQNEADRHRAEAELDECEGPRTDRQQEQQARTTELVPRLPIQDGEEVKGPAVHSPVHGAESDGVRETMVPQEEREEQKDSSRGQRDPGRRRPQHSKPSKSSRQTWRSQWVRPAPSQPPKDDSKESRHPFALYGSGEKDADMAGRKTHNVGPAASTNEIHESALRAKTRREVERQIQTQRSERRRAKSADMDKTRKLVQPEFNPWLTEYMRCFSVRSR